MNNSNLNDVKEKLYIKTLFNPQQCCQSYFISLVMDAFFANLMNTYRNIVHTVLCKLNLTVLSPTSNDVTFVGADL